MEQNQEVTFVQYYELNYGFMWSLLVFPLRSFFGPRSNPGFHVAFGCHFSTSLPICDSPQSSLVHHDFVTLERHQSVISQARSLSVWVCLLISHELLAWIPQKGCPFLLGLSYQQINDVDNAHSWWCSPWSLDEEGGFLCCKVTVFLFFLNKYLGERLSLCK